MFAWKDKIVREVWIDSKVATLSVAVIHIHLFSSFNMTNDRHILYQVRKSETFLFSLQVTMLNENALYRERKIV